MLDPYEANAVAERFGATPSQVHRDHLISHLLSALSQRFGDDVIFFGGTALSRTFAPDGRLSEDIDLIAVGNRRSTAQAMDEALLRALRREFPDSSWRPSLSHVREAESAILSTPSGAWVRIQLLSRSGYPPWPTERRTLVQRYSDAGSAALLVPTSPSFAAWKTSAWTDRAASRDLFDLWLLARIGAIDAEAGQLFRRFGPTGTLPSPASFSQAPDETTWRRELASQTRLRLTALEAARVVGRAWSDVERGRSATRQRR